MSVRDYNQNHSLSAANSIARLLLAIALVLTALASATIISRHYSSPEAYEHQIEVLDAKKDAVLRMSVATATASAVISAIPDDACTPIADQLASISKSLAFVLAAILLEKYLLTTLGFLFFSVIVPAGCLGMSVAMLLPRSSYIKGVIISIAVRILVVGAVVWTSIPCSVLITDKIEETYASSIGMAVEATTQMTESSEQDESQLYGLEYIYTTIGDALLHPFESAKNAADKVADLVAWAKSVLSIAIEGFAVVLVTSCVIPVLVPMLALWLLKSVFLLPVSSGREARPSEHRQIEAIQLTRKG